MADIHLPWPAAPDWKSWRHITKLDPERSLSIAQLDRVYASGTDAIILGGSSGMTADAVSAALTRLQEAPMPVALEVSTLESAMPGAALFLIPFVLNARDARWLGGAQAEALTRILPLYEEIIPYHLLLPEAYLVLNPNSAVARLTGADTAIDEAGAAAYATLAGRVLHLPMIYVEYSGSFGDMGLLQAVKAHAGESRVIYGGGIASGEQARQAAAIANTVVVGNLVYTNPQRLQETVAATRG